MRIHEWESNFWSLSIAGQPNIIKITWFSFEYCTKTKIQRYNFWKERILTFFVFITFLKKCTNFSSQGCTSWRVIKSNKNLSPKNFWLTNNGNWQFYWASGVFNLIWGVLVRTTTAATNTLNMHILYLIIKTRVCRMIFAQHLLGSLLLKLKEQQLHCLHLLST